MSDDFLRVSYSSLNTFSSCARKFEFSKLYPRRARDYDTFAADVGTALHHGYQTYLVTRDENKAMWAMMESYPYEGEWNQENDFRSLQACVVTLEEMIGSAPMNDYEIAHMIHPDGHTVPCVEVPFELRLKGLTLPDGRGIAVTGFVDAFLEHRIHGSFHSTDIKTHRSFIRDASSKYKFNGQQVPYGIVLEHIQGHSIDEFTVHYMDTLIDLAEPRVELYSYKKDKESVQEWLMNTVLKCQQIVRFAEMDYFPRIDSGCMFFNKPCYFLDICEIRDRESITKWLLEGEEPEHKPAELAWVVAEIDLTQGE